MIKETKQKLKAFFAANFYKYADTEGKPWSELTGGDIEAFSLEAVGKVIDAFEEEKFKEEIE
jgi:hypothetical protein